MSDWNDYYDDDYDHEYIYVEESYDVVDDLAEHAVASPPLYENAEIHYDYDPFDYWEDIEYYSDGYTDVNGKTSAPSESDTRSGGKRKLSGGNSSAITSKRRKLSQAVSVSGGLPVRPISPVLWQSKTAPKSTPRLAPDETLAEPYSLLKDWRTRFKDEPGLLPVHDSTKAGGSHDIIGKNSARSGQPDPSNDPYALSATELQLLAESGISLDALRESLRKGLAGSGAGSTSLDESKLLQCTVRMLVGEQGAEDVAGQLAEDLLAQAEEDPKAAGLSEWIGHQVGASDNEQEDSEMSDVQDEPAIHPSGDLLRAASRGVPGSTALSPDGKVPEAASEVTSTTHPHGSAAHSRVSKRKAKDSLGEDSSMSSRPKRPARSFAAPTASSKAKATVKERQAK